MQRKKHTSKARKTELKQIYKTKRHIFDKALRKAERNYKKGVLEDIETVNTENPSNGFTNLKVSSLNINGWTESNKQIRQALIKCTEPDVLYLQETHLDSGRTIEINGYYWIGHN